MSFAGSIASITFVSSRCAGQRQLDEDPVDRVVGVQLGEELQELVLGRVGREPEVVRVDADGGRGLVLAGDVDVGGRVVADEDGREPDLAELLHLRGDLFAHLRRERLAVDQLGGHRREVTQEWRHGGPATPQERPRLDRRAARGARPER